VTSWTVCDLLLVPHFAFPPSAIVKRPPLSATARRAGWVGCNFALDRIPPDARIPIVTTIRPGRVGDTECVMVTPPEVVREKFRQIKPLKELSIKERGWTLDVLNVVRRISSPSSRPSPYCSDFPGKPSPGLRPPSPAPAGEGPGEGGAIGRHRSLIEKNNQKLLTSFPTTEFKNADVYAFERELAALHPGNRHIRDKIRQQLQVLRDTGFLVQPERGVWRVK
jgi:hypothetical protein